MNPNNEPAFPVGTDITQGQVAPSGGMTLLDYFAAKAMQGVMATDKWHELPPEAVIAETAYAVAAAMLEERKKHL